MFNKKKQIRRLESRVNTLSKQVEDLQKESLFTYGWGEVFSYYSTLPMTAPLTIPLKTAVLALMEYNGVVIEKVKSVPESYTVKPKV